MLPASFVKITFCCPIYSFPSTAFSIPSLKPSSHEIAQLLYSFTLSSNSRLYDTWLVDGTNGMPSSTSCSSFITNFFSFALIATSQSTWTKSHILSFFSVIVRYDFIHVGFWKKDAMDLPAKVSQINFIPRCETVISTLLSSYLLQCKVPSNLALFLHSWLKYEFTHSCPFLSISSQ